MLGNPTYPAQRLPCYPVVRVSILRLIPYRGLGGHCSLPGTYPGLSAESLAGYNRPRPLTPKLTHKADRLVAKGHFAPDVP